MRELQKGKSRLDRPKGSSPSDSGRALGRPGQARPGHTADLSIPPRASKFGWNATVACPRLPRAIGPMSVRRWTDRQLPEEDKARITGLKKARHVCRGGWRVSNPRRRLDGPVECGGEEICFNLSPRHQEGKSQELVPSLGATDRQLRMLRIGRQPLGVD